MLRYRLTTPVKSVVIVSLDSDDQNKSARIEYEGDRLLIPTVQHWLERESGAFGHIIGINCRGDILVSLKQLSLAPLLFRLEPG